MSDWRVIRKAGTDEIVLARAQWCQDFWCHFRGLMLRRTLPDDEGLFFVFRRQNRTETSIHMFFVFFAIAAVWINEEGVVVEKKLAKPWRPFYAPAKPARYLIEAQPVVLDRVNVGDHLTFDEKAKAPR
jgi:uncharacterized membrane protein (UPF0127 family)